MFGVGFSEVIVIAIIGLLLFGGNLPDVAHTLGKLFFKIQKGFREIKNDLDKEIK